MAKVLLAGESWISSTIEYKGFDSFTNTRLEIGCEDFLRELRKEGHQVAHMMAHEVPEHFPWTLEELNQYDVVILSDIGSNSLLFAQQVFYGGEQTVNRLELLAQWVQQGHGLMMAGGYLSFAGFEGKAHYHNTAIEKILPVHIAAHDDRVETPQGAQLVINHQYEQHPVVREITDIPQLLGYQQLQAKENAQVLCTINDDPALIVGTYGQGRSLAFASDISPHWAPKPFIQWEGYGVLFSNCVKWLAREI